MAKCMCVSVILSLYQADLTSVKCVETQPKTAFNAPFTPKLKHV